MRLLILTLSIALISCVNTSVPKKVKRASKRLEKHAKGINNIVKIYPELMDSLTTTVHDTITIDSHTVDTSFSNIVDTIKIDSIIKSFIRDTVNKERIRYIRNQIIKEALRDTAYTYNDSIVRFTLIIKGGKFYFKTTVKKKEVPYIKQETTLNPKIIDTPLWKNTWFWLLILIIVVLLSIIRAKK